MAAPPSVNNVHIVGDVVEGSTIRGVGDYFGGREGPSKFEWLCEHRDTGLVYFSHMLPCSSGAQICFPNLVFGRISPFGFLLILFPRSFFNFSLLLLIIFIYLFLYVLFSWSIELNLHT